MVTLGSWGTHSGSDSISAVPPKPSIWADPGPIVSRGSPVTIWCQGSLQANAFALYKDRGSEPLDVRILQASSNKTRFLIQSMSPQYAGLYQCAYTTGDRLSERSEPLFLVLTGEYSAPYLSAHPGPVVTSGGNVSLLCSSLSMSGLFHLLKEGGAERPRRMKSEWRASERRWQAVFPVGPVSSSHGGTYRCYGSSSYYPNLWSEPSVPLYLEVTGVYREPSLSVQPGPLLLPGDNLTLQCHSEPGFDRFALTKDKGPTPRQHLQGQHSPSFPLGPVNLTHGGRYRCYSGHNLSYVWSAPSPPLDILIAGKYRKPSFSAQPSPSVPWGVTVTLQCQSEVRADTFHLHREGSLEPPQQLCLQHMEAPSQANFTISPVTWSHQGTYRCYSSHSSSPFQLSQPSDPLELLVSGGSGRPSLLTQQGPIVASGQKLTLQCRSDISYDRFALSKEGGQDLPQSSVLQPQAGLSQANFPLGSVSSSHGGRYRCYGGRNLSSEWSAPSDPLDILVAGWFPDRPSLSVQPGPTVASGENVTLLCQSWSWRDTFFLTKEGEADPPLRLSSQSRAQQHRAQFSMGPVTLAHGGTYRCYSSLSLFPYQLSQPSDPLELLVSGPSGNPSPLPTGPTSTTEGSKDLPLGRMESGPQSTQGLQWYWNVLIGVSVALVLLLFLLLFVFLFLRHQRQSKGRTSGATDPGPKDRGLQTRSNPAAGAQEEPLYAAMKDPQPGEGLELDPQQNRTHDD
ncbi:leukocyte immunoglobulin-like receptor subfamily A member 3, partial [Sturnira hondurensis]|uniref:leukocyte immunoglobulin-like receptor subfamily A member 3 n=1 Tax=Sturnira hondurensis TaxID=192404 RepID=UPI0018797F67